MDSKTMHDLLLSVKPDGAVHEAGDCAICTALDDGQAPNHTEGGVLDVSITQEDIDKAVAAAVGPLNAELEALRQFKTEVESTDAAKAAQAQVDAAQAAAEELQSKLDATVIEVTEANTKYDNLVAWLTAEAERIEAEAAIAALREERIEAVKALQVFPDEYVEENAQRYAEMSPEVFEASMEDWKAAKATQAPAKETEEEEELPVKTAFVATRDEDGTKKVSPMRDVLRYRHEGIDLRKIR